MTTWNRSFIDAFQRANSSTIGNGWSPTSGGAGNFSISSKALAIAAGSYSGGSVLARNCTSNPASLIPGTNEGSVNQRAVFTFYQAGNDVAVGLRVNSAGTRGYYAFFLNNAYFIFSLASGGQSFLAQLNASGTYSGGLVQGDFSAVSSGSTTTLTLTITDIPSGSVIAAQTLADSTAGLQASDVSSGSTWGISTYNGSASSLNSIQGFTDQAVTVPGTALVAGTPSLGAVSGPTIAASSTAPSGGASPYSYQWFLSQSPPAGGSYGKMLNGQVAATALAMGLQGSNTYYLTLQTTDSTAYNPQVAYSTPLPATTPAITSGPSSRADLVLWADADALAGQADGSALVGSFGQFAAINLPSGFAAPAYRASAMPNGKAALDFNGGATLQLAGGVDPDVEAALNGSFSYTVIYNYRTAGAQYGTLLGKTSTHRVWGLQYQNVPLNYDSYGSANSGTFNAIYPSDNSNGPALPVAIFQFSYDASTGTVLIGNNNGTFTSYPANTTIDAYNYGGVLAIGAYANGNYPLTGQVAQVMIYKSASTRAQMIAEQAYFRSRYLAATNAGSIACLGDSRTAGYDISGRPGTTGSYSNFPWPSQLTTTLGNNFKIANYGISGSQTANVTPSGPEYAYLVNATSILIEDPKLPKIVVFGPLGVNDYRSTSPTVPSSTASSNLIAGIQAVEGLSAGSQFTFKTIWCSEMDEAGGLTAWDAYRNSIRSAMLSAVPPVAGTRGFVDLLNNATLGVAGASANTAYFCGDELHPVGESVTGVMGAGYGAMAALIAPAVAALMPHRAPFNRIYPSGGFHGPFGGGYSS